uniref:Putative secreted protein n=1 Tax=Ixodes ricinus TaxID=34613 RepID=A0A6B0UKF1_IXORI
MAWGVLRPVSNCPLLLFLISLLISSVAHGVHLVWCRAHNPNIMAPGNLLGAKLLKVYPHDGPNCCFGPRAAHHVILRHRFSRSAGGPRPALLRNAKRLFSPGPWRRTAAFLV